MTTFERHRPQEQDSTLGRDELLDALRAALEALNIPNAATNGDEEIRDAILVERVMHAVVMLDSVLSGKSYTDVAWSTAYLRERLAEHPR